MVKLIGVARNGQYEDSLSPVLGTVLAILAALIVCALALAPRADAHIYWSNPTGNIGRANLNGTGVNKRFIKGAVSPLGIAVDARHVYWADPTTSTIGRAKLNGTGLKKDFVSIPGPFGPYTVAVDAGHIYWTILGALIGRARINGTRTQPKFIRTSPEGSTWTSPGGHTYGVAVNTRHVYWTTNAEQVFYPDKIDTIGRAYPDGTGVKGAFISIGHSGPDSIAVHGHYIYWTSAITNSISRARLNGTGVHRRFITTGYGSPRDIAVTGRHIYWANVITGKIGRANLDGTHVHRGFITTGGKPWGIAVDSSRRMPLGGGLG